MPTYTFQNNDTGEVVELHLSFSEHDEYKKNNPNMTQLITGAPAVVSGVVGMGRMKNDDGWRETMSKIAEAHPGTSIADRYGTKSTKEVKTREVIKKHIKKQQGKK